MRLGKRIPTPVGEEALWELIPDPTIILETDEIVIKRIPRAGNHALSILKDIYVEKGTMDDWKTLCELHYKGHTLAAGSRFYRCVYEQNGVPSPIGIMVFANPRPLDRDRMRVFPHMKPNQTGKDTTMMNKHRIREGLNKDFTWNNRTVLDTMYRSGGIAYRFKNLAYRMYCCEYGKRVVESRSSMGKFNPFSIKAGMKFTTPTSANALQAGIEFFRSNFIASPHDVVALLEELAAMPEGIRVFTERKLREFYYRHSSMEKSGDKRMLGTSRVDALDIGYVLRQVQQLVFGATVYWVWMNPDITYEKINGRRTLRFAKLPSRLPLLTFDNQGPNEPLRLDLINGVKDAPNL